MFHLPATIKTLLGYPGSLPTNYRAGLGVVVVITVLTTILDSFAIALMVPLVELLLDTKSELAAIPLFRWIDNIFSFLGLSMTPTLLSIVIIAVFIARATGIAIQMFLARHLNARFELSLRKKTYRALMQTSWRFFTHQNSGQLLDMLMTQTSRAGQTLNIYATAIAALVTTAIYFITSMVVSFELSLAAAAYTGLIVVLMSLFLGYSKKLGTRLAAASRRVSFEAYERLGGMKTIKSAALDDFSIRRYDGHIEQYARVHSLVGITQGVTASVSELLFLVALVVGLFFATATLGIPAAVLLLFTLLFFRMFQRSRQFLTSMQSFIELSPSLARVDDLVREATLESERTGGSEDFQTDEGISLDNVSFAYEPGIRTIQNLSLNIPRKSSAAIVGVSGAGKTTIIDIITGLIEPDEGQVLIGNRPLVDLSLRSWRNKIAYITQGVALFDDTVVNNVALGDEHLNHALVNRALAQSGADRFVNELPEGSETTIGERGIRLSGGQRQRIALARALYRQPDLLILDEATSELDTESERLFQETIDLLRGDMTILIVAHRLSTIMNVDNIFVLENGTIAESGRPIDLMNSNGIFSTMVNQSTHTWSEEAGWSTRASSFGTPD